MVEVEKAWSEEHGGILEGFPQSTAIAALVKDILEGKSFWLPKERIDNIIKQTIYALPN